MSVGFRVLPLVGVAVVFGLAPIALQALPQDSQSQQSPSVADAARRAKQKKNSAKPSKVIDDDNLSSNLKTGGADVTNVGASAAATVNPDAAAKPDATAGDQPAPQQADQAAPKQDGQDVAGQDAEIVEAKALVARTEKELDLLKRGFALDSEAYYSKTDYSSDKAGKAKLDGEQQEIADKQQDLEAVKARLAALQEQRSRRKAKSNVPPASEAEKPAALPQL